MIFELLHAPMPAGYGEALLPLALCKQRLRIDGSDEDVLLEWLRDAALQMVETHVSLLLGPRAGNTCRFPAFPASDQSALLLGVYNPTDIQAVTWKTGSGSVVTGDPASFRLSLHGTILPAYGMSWPSDADGYIEFTFSAGFAAGAAPPRLLLAALTALGHLDLHREAIVSEGHVADLPPGVMSLCAPFRRIVI